MKLRTLDLKPAIGEIDKAVVDSEYVIIGSGIRKSKIAVPGSFLASLPNVIVIEKLANIK